MFCWRKLLPVSKCGPPRFVYAACLVVSRDGLDTRKSFKVANAAATYEWAGKHNYEFACFMLIKSHDLRHHF